ncbi:MULTISPECIES: hypothetical protein [unclassified Serratia (in: enterobacteria)]|uniref:hypothetical protein n=1 Tax=unclassified Serratia (in: enterobacteria) TaxID=2647522 RepID=UPI0030768098
MLKITFPLLLSLLLTGCGDNLVNKLENTKVPRNAQYTYGQVLNHREMCQETTWEESPNEDDEDVIRVIYHCVLKPGKEKYAYSEKEAKNRYTVMHDEKMASYRAERQEKLEQYHQTVQTEKARLKNLQDFMGEGTLDWRFLADNVNRNPDVEALIARAVDKVLILGIISGRFIDEFPWRLDSEPEMTWVFSRADTQGPLEYLRQAESFLSAVENVSDPANPVIKRLIEQKARYMDVCARNKAEYRENNRQAQVLDSDIAECELLYQKGLPNARAWLDMVKNDLASTITTDAEAKIANSQAHIKDSEEKIATLNSTETDLKMKRSAEREAAEAQQAYANSHLKKGEEVIIWRYNPLTQRFSMEESLLIETDADDQTHTSDQSFQKIFIAFVQGFKNIDDYTNVCTTTREGGWECFK